MNVNQLGMSQKLHLCLSLLFGAVVCFGCVADEPLEDGLVEGIGKVSRASLSLDESGLGQVDFEFAYLIGVNDSEGIQQFDWTYRLINPEREVFGEAEQMMRAAEPEKNTIYVQGTKPRILEVSVPADSLEDPLILWIKFSYNQVGVAEIFVELEPGTEYLDEEPLEKLNRFAQGA